MAAFALFVATTPEGLSNGDAAVYAQQIAEQRFSDRPVHMAYYVLGAVATGFRADFSDRAMNVLSAASGAGTVALIVWMTGFVTGRWLLGLAAGSALLAHLTFVQNSVWAEVYGPQTFFLILAFWCFWRRHAALAGVALAISVSITPSSLLAVPAMIAGRPQWRQVAVLGLVGGALTLAVVAGVWQEYLWGDRGVLGAAGASLGLGERVVKEGFEIVFGVGPFLPFLGLGLWGALRQRPYRPYLLALTVLWAVTFVLGERFADVPVQLPTWVLATPLLALGLSQWSRLLASVDGRTRWLILGLFLLLALAPLWVLPLARRESADFAGLPSGLEVTGGLVLLISVLVAGLLRPKPLAPTPDAFAPSDTRPVPRTDDEPGPGSASEKGGFYVPAVDRRAAATWIGSLLVALMVTTSLVRLENRSIEQYRQAVLSVGEQADADFLAIGSWSRGILFEHYLYGASYTGRWINTAWLRGEWGEEEKVSSRELLATALADGRQIWTVGESRAVAARLSAAGYGETGRLEVEGGEPVLRFERLGEEDR